MQAMLKKSRYTLEELHYVCGPADGRMWADPSLTLARFGFLRSLTMHALPASVPDWLSRLPISLERLTIIAAPGNQAAYSLDDRSVVWASG